MSSSVKGPKEAKTPRADSVTLIEPTTRSQADADVAEIVTQIGPRLRQLRTAHRLSLQQLADRSDVSPAAIHKVEQGTMVPTITTLLKLAAAFDRSVSYFVAEDEEAPKCAVFTPADERRELFTSHEGLRLHLISGPFTQFAVAASEAVLQPGASSGESPLRHAGEELILVVSGQLRVTVGVHEFELSPGDSVHFNTEYDHRWSNPGSEPATAIWMALRSD